MSTAPEKHLGGAPMGNVNSRKHGSHRARLELKELVRRSMDGRTTEAREVAEWIGDLVADLGGLENLTTAQRTIVEVAGITRMQLARVDAFIAAMPSLIHYRRRALFPIVAQRQALADGLCRRLNEIGLERKARRVPSLADYLAAKSVERDQSNGNGADAPIETSSAAAPSADRGDST
jgi:hypothetical protein